MGIATLLVVLAAVVPAHPATLTDVERDTLTKAMLADRESTAVWLERAPNSYLATIGRRDFGNRARLTVGRAADNDVRLADSTIALHHLAVTVVGDSFAVEALDLGAVFTVKDSVMRAAIVPPSSIGVGRYTLRLSHQRFPAIIVFDPQSPRYKLYKGLSYFPVDLAYRYELPLTPNPKPDTTIILSTRGNQRRAVRVGWFDFDVKGTKCRLEANRLLEPGVGENDVSVFFRDATTGKESYDVGRYVDPERLPDGRYVLDFNMAYNPACAFSEHYNCPIPPKANRLAVAIRAGEKNPHYLH
jgi:uncharacterized protein (DUF1684 family)